MSTAAVTIDGLADFVRNLGKLNSDLPKAVRVAMNEAASLVVDRAQPQVPKRTGRAARSIKARSTRTAVRVVEGGPRAEYMPWLDYGGRVGRRKATRRRFIADGRYLYPSYEIERASGRFEEVMSRALLDVAAQAGIEVD